MTFYQWILLIVILLLVSTVIVTVMLNRSVHQTDGLHTYLLTVMCDNQIAEISATQYIKNMVTVKRIRKKTVRVGLIELVMEIQLVGDNTEFVNDLMGITGVKNVELVCSESSDAIVKVNKEKNE